MMGYVTPPPHPPPSHLCTAAFWGCAWLFQTHVCFLSTLAAVSSLFVCLFVKSWHISVYVSQRSQTVPPIYDSFKSSLYLLLTDFRPTVALHTQLPFSYLFFFFFPLCKSILCYYFFFFFDFLSCLPACHTVCVCHLLFCCRESNDSECLSRFTFSSVVPLLHSLMSSVLLTNRCTMTALEEDHWFGPASLTCLCFSPMLLLFLFYFLRLIYLSQTAQAVASGWQAARATSPLK